MIWPMITRKEGDLHVRGKHTESSMKDRGVKAGHWNKKLL
jgi:hypothetical protein